MWKLIQEGGFIMFPLIVFSLMVWAIIFERTWRYWSLNRDLRSFQLEAMNALLRQDEARLKTLCAQNPHVPTARILAVAMERLQAKDSRMRSKWREALERARQQSNQDLKQYLWILGTIASASPFVGLFGTVVGILKSFQEMARTGEGGFTVVAAGISEALIATAAGIIVAVIAVMAFNAFQAHWARLVMTVRVQTEELAELLSQSEPASQDGGHGA